VKQNKPTKQKIKEKRNGSRDKKKLQKIMIARSLQFGSKNF
jgi:hypothetical protein